MCEEKRDLNDYLCNQIHGVIKNLNEAVQGAMCAHSGIFWMPHMVINWSAEADHKNVLNILHFRTFNF